MRPNKRSIQNQTEGLLISLPTEVVVREIPAVKIKTSTIEVTSVEDISRQRKIVAYTKELGPITLWENEMYDRIGQWTDSDIETRLIELFLK
jgi:hypothetical protein